MNKITVNDLTPIQLYKIRKAIRGEMGKIADKLGCHRSDVTKALAEPSTKDIAIRKEALRLAQENGFDVNELLNS